MSKLTLDEIKQDAEIVRLNELMRTTSRQINDRLAFLWKENDIIVEVPLFESLLYHNKENDHLNQ